MDQLVEFSPPYGGQSTDRNRKNFLRQVVTASPLNTHQQVWKLRVLGEYLKNGCQVLQYMGHAKKFTLLMIMIGEYRSMAVVSREMKNIKHTNNSFIPFFVSNTIIVYVR